MNQTDNNFSNNKIYDCKLTRKIEWGREDREIEKQNLVWANEYDSILVSFLSVYYLQIDIDGNIMHKCEKSSLEITFSKR